MLVEDAEEQVLELDAATELITLDDTVQLLEEPDSETVLIVGC